MYGTIFQTLLSRLLACYHFVISWLNLIWVVFVLIFNFWFFFYIYSFMLSLSIVLTVFPCILSVLVASRPSVINKWMDGWINTDLWIQQVSYIVLNCMKLQYILLNWAVSFRRTRLDDGGIMFSGCPSVRPSVTKLVNTVFWKRLNGFWCKIT